MRAVSLLLLLASGPALAMASEQHCQYFLEPEMCMADGTIGYGWVERCYTRPVVFSTNNEAWY